MSLFDCIIKDGIVVFPDFTRETDLACLDGKIVAISSPGTFLESKNVINAKGCYVLPGAIDPHVHVHWPFLAATTADDYAIASRAAALGGTTTFIDFAHPKMGATPIERINNRLSEIGNESTVDFGLHCVLSNRDPETLDQIEKLVKMGITSFKLYMTYSRRKIMADDSILFYVMKKAAELGALVCVHAENGPVGDAMEAQFIAEGRTKAVDFPLYKPNFVEAEAVERAIFWAKQTGVRLYFFHLSTKEGLEIIRDAKNKGFPIAAETCPQYLLLNDSVFARPGVGHRFICSPPIRSRKDNDALWEGIKEGTISAIGTDHCAFTIAQKDLGIDNFVDVPNGLPGIETRLSLMWTEGVNKNRITPQQLTRILSYNPAQIFGLFPRKGCIAIGSDADFVVFDPSAHWTLTQSQTNMGVDWTPYEDWEMQGKVIHTIIRGEVIVEDGKYIGSSKKGRFVQRHIDHSN
jgi:dihydropyrimidinase